MVTTPTKPLLELGAETIGGRVPAWPLEANLVLRSTCGEISSLRRDLRPSGGDALQALLAFSAMHQQVRRRRALAERRGEFETLPLPGEFEPEEQFVLDDVLQLVADRAIAITGADGIGIALAENNEIVLRASSGTIKPDVGARIQRDSAFSGACFRSAQIIRCDETETDDRVNLYACRQLGARSMVAVPLCGRRRVIGLVQAFSSHPFGFNDSDVASLELLAELILAALKPEDEDRFAESAQIAEKQLAAPPVRAVAPLAPVIPQPSDIPPRTLKNIAAVPEPAPKLQAKIVPPAPESAAALPSIAAAVETKREEKLCPDPVSEPETLSHHPGVAVVLMLVVVGALVAGGVWWKLKNAQIGSAIIQPQTISAAPVAAAKRPATTVASSASASQIASPNTTSDAQSGSSANTDATTDANLPAEPGKPSTQISKFARINGIRHWSSADSSTVVLDLEDQVQYEAHRLSSPDRIYFDLHDTSLAGDMEGRTIEIGDPLLARVRVAQPVAGLTRVVLETRGNSNYSVSLEPNPYRLVVQVTKLGIDTKTQVNLFPGAAPAEPKLAIVIPPPTREDLQLRAHVPKMRIVVDAGHGGWDLGTVGRRGLLEKDLVLEIAQRLGKLLESRLGADVILTRKDDNYIPLDERAGVANQSQADLFVSVHANYSDLPSARGVETYYTNFFSAPNAKDLETRQQDRSKSANTTALSAADLHERIEQSRRLAASVQRSLYGTLSTQNPGLRDRGVKSASYVVLTETAMPGILAEVSFVSSPTDEQKLRSDGYREQIAEALYKGIARYAASSHGVKMASAAK